jgi:hypothetical protein
MVTVFLLLFALSNPALLLQCFLMAAVVLYGWFANRFYLQIILRKLPMTKKQKDWLQVNAIVAFAFSVISIAGIAVVLFHPEIMQEELKQFEVQSNYTPGQFANFAYVFLAIYLTLFTHIIWTYLLMRKYKDYFAS